MSLYDKDGNSLISVYDYLGSSLSSAYDVSGTEVFDDGDYDTYSTEYQHAILQARDAWKTQYRADSDVIPLVLHTDQHGRFRTTNSDVVAAFQYLGLALKWPEISAMVGLGDVDLPQNVYPQMTTILNYAADRKKQINMWGNHDLWQNYSTVNDQFVVDFETTYPEFGNETYGDVSYAYNHKGIEYHIDRKHNVKYVCLAGWEIDKALGGYSHYVIGQQSMAGIVDMLEMEDGYDIILLSHCNPWDKMEVAYALCEGGTASTVSDVLYDTPVEISNLGSEVVHPAEVKLSQMLADRNSYQSGTIKDSYGNVHSYDFTNCSGKILCGFHGHWHQDGYGWSKTGGVLQMMFDAYAYQTHPLYFVNVDRTNEAVTFWKIGDDALVQTRTIPFSEPVAVGT